MTLWLILLASQLSQGVERAAKGDYEAAIPYFARACSSALSDGCYFLGRALYAVNRFEPALDAYAQALPGDQRPWRVRDAMGLALEALGRAAEAETEFRLSITLNQNTDPEPRLHYGRFLFRQGRTREALKPLESAANQFPRSAQAQWEIGRVLYQLGRYREAALRLEAARELEPARLLLEKAKARLQ